MKKYTVEKPLTTNIKHLLLNGDVIFVEEKLVQNSDVKEENVFEVYDMSSRQYLGYLTSTDKLKLEKDYE